MYEMFRATANAVLALYGLPEPAGDVPVSEVADLLDSLAREMRFRRTEGFHPYDVGEMFRGRLNAHQESSSQ